MIEYVMNLLDNMIQDLKEAKPEKKAQLLRIMSGLIDLSTDAINESPEFRKGFARVHAEFLQYPECREIFEAGSKTYQQLNSE